MRVSEIYLSVQGEGPNVGEPTVFLRFGGCNLRCPGFPCDTPFAIFPEFRNEWKKMTPEEIVEEVIKTAGPFEDINVCLTGGEPFLQPNKEMRELVHRLSHNEHIDIVEAFTNGAILWDVDVKAFVDVIMDWKLPGSGENTLDKNRLANIQQMSSFDAIKFTIKDRRDFEEAKAIYDNIIVPNEMAVQVFYGIVWDGEYTNEALVDTVLREGLPWRLNVQVHNHVFDRNRRGI